MDDSLSKHDDKVNVDHYYTCDPAGIKALVLAGACDPPPDAEDS
jgi:hypothetical protein